MDLFLEGFDRCFGDFFFVAPVIESWRVEAWRGGAISALEKKRGSRVIVMIHRQESVNVLGIPVVRYINIDDSEDVLRAFGSPTKTLRSI